MNKFKVGDKVYCPYYGTDVFEVQPNTYDEDLDKYPLMVCGETFTVHGKSSDRSYLQDIFHATYENQELLEKLHLVGFENPHAKPTGKEIVKAMLAHGDKAVLCWVSDSNKYPTSNNPIALITSVSEMAVYVTEPDGTMWRYATPFDPRTLEPITELPEPTRRMATLTVPHYNS